MGLFKRDDQLVLCRAEVPVVKGPQDLGLLNSVVCEYDEMLSAEIQNEKSSRGHNVTDWKANGSPKV